MKNKTATIIMLILFIILSLITIIVYVYNLNYLKFIDIPTHFVGGILIAMFLPKTIMKKNKTIFALVFAGVVVLGWEAIEITMSNKNFIPELFRETQKDRIKDLIMGLLGFTLYIKKHK